MTISQSVAELFNLVRARNPELRWAWSAVSIEIGRLLPNSLLIASVLRVGELYLLVRAMEDERGSKIAGDGPDDPSLEYQMWLSELWVGSAYAIFRLLADDRRFAASDAVRDLAYHLELVRIPLEKHEIVRDRKLSAPLPMHTFPPDGPPGTYTYDNNDPARAHIMPTELSSRGSAMWLVYDHRTGGQFFLERRELSDRMIALRLSAASP